jgi:hypothetical protein
MYLAGEVQGRLSTFVGEVHIAAVAHLWGVGVYFVGVCRYRLYIVYSSVSGCMVVCGVCTVQGGGEKKYEQGYQG